MTADQLSILQTIIENPADDAPRLIYAEYLDGGWAYDCPEPQPERAELIRVQCKLAQMQADPKRHTVPHGNNETPEYTALRLRERELLMIFWKHWFGFE